MKKILLMTGLAVLLSAGSVMALYLPDGTDVGGVDTLHAWTNITSGDQVEIDWVNGVLGTSYTIADLLKDDLFTDSPWLNVKDTPSGPDLLPNVWAYDLERNGGYYYIKTGAGVSYNEHVEQADRDALRDLVFPEHFLFVNDASADWAVIDLSSFTSKMNDVLSAAYGAGSTSKLYTVKFTIDNIDRVSHIGEFGTPIPEPASVLLLGTGLAGLAGVMFRQRRQD